MLKEQFIMERRYLKNVSAKTVAWYEHSFKAFEGALDNRTTMVARITELRQRGVAAVSVNTYLRCINAYFRWLHEEHKHELLRLPKLKEEQKVLATFSPQHVTALTHHRPKGRNAVRAWMISLVMLDCGLRASEALGLRRQDLDFENLVVRVHGKGNKERLLPMSIELRKHLLRYTRERDGYIFSTRTGTVVTVRNFQRDLNELCQRLGISGVRTSPHTLRHTFAAGYLRNGGNLYYLSKILGHTSVKTTERYLQSLGIEDLKAVHERFSLLAAGR
ncbi:MAG TPA: tyrosine-type recombinase/integrase [Bryobacteraceae bacterium]